MNYSYRLSFFCLFSLVGILTLPSLTEAQFTPLVGVPGLGTTDNFSQYINALYTLSISVAALLAVIKMIIAGMKYMLSDVVTTKQDALGDIKGAIGGLVIVISAVLILQVINPQLVNLDIFNNISATKAPPKTSGIAPPAGTPASLPWTRDCDYIGGVCTASSTLGGKTVCEGGTRNCQGQINTCRNIDRGTPRADLEKNIVTCNPK